MKVIPPSFLACVGILLATPVLTHADTVTLKSGEALEGKVLSETDQEIVMDVTVAAGITDQKTLARSDVQTVEKTPPDEIAYQAIKGCQIEAHSLPASSYVAIVKSLEAFLKTYPQSARTGEVQEKLNAFKEEQERVKAKNIKWDNRWYTPEEFEKNKNLLHAQMHLAAMREQVARRDFVSALNTFDQIEKTHAGSAALPDAIELAQNVIRLLTIEMDRAVAIAKNQESQFNNGIVLVPEPQKSQMIATRQGQIAAAEAAVAAAERSGIKWKPFLPIASKSADALKATLAAEGPRLEALPVAAMRTSIASLKSAEAALKEENLAGAEVKLKEAETLWSQNEQIAALKAEIEVLKKKPSPTPTPTPTPKPTPKPSPTPTPTPTPAPTPSPTPTPKPWYSFF